MKGKFRRLAAVTAAAVALTACLPTFAATIEIEGTFGESEVGKWLTAILVKNGSLAKDPLPSDIAYITQEKINPDGSFKLALPMNYGDYELRTNQQIKFDTGCYLYVSSEKGRADGDGSPASPTDTIAGAFALAKEGYTIVLLDTVKIPNNATWKIPCSLTVTGKNPITQETAGGIDMTGTTSFRLEGPVKFENLTFTTKAAASMSENANRIFACGNKLIMGEGLTMTNPIDVLGGNSANQTADSTDLTLLSGNYRRIYGGGWNSPVTGDTNIVIGGTVNSGYAVEDSSPDYYDARVFGGGVNQGSEVGGDTHITIKDNAAMAYLVGGGSGSGSDIKGGETYISIEGGRVMNVYGGTIDKTTVFQGDTHITMTGGSVESIFGGSQTVTMKGSTYISVTGGEIKRRIIGGCYNEWNGSWKSDYSVEGATTVWIGGNPELITGNGLSSGNKDNSGIFAASRIASNAATENSYLIFADDTYSKYSGKIGDTSGWGSTFKSNHDYLIKIGLGGKAELGTAPGKLVLTANAGETAICNGQETPNGEYTVTGDTTITFGAANPVKFTESGAEVSANITAESSGADDYVLAAIYNSQKQLISTNRVKLESSGNYKLTLDFTPSSEEQYTVKLFVWNTSTLSPLEECYTFGPLSK